MRMIVLSIKGDEIHERTCGQVVLRKTAKISGKYGLQEALAKKDRIHNQHSFNIYKILKFVCFFGKNAV